MEYMELINIKLLGDNVSYIIRQCFDKMKTKFPAISDVRDLGAMMALEVEEGQ